jgi:hypothetical protein
MKNPVLALLIGCAAAPLWAQSGATAPGADLDAERARLGRERAAVEERYTAERAACYKKFAVEGCLEESRRQRRLATDDIKRQEAAINEFDRKRRGAAALDRLEQKAASPSVGEAEARREQSLQSQQERERRAAEHAADRERAAAESEARKRQFEDKQRAHAEEQAKAARRRAEAPAQRQAYEEKLRQAEEARAENERRRAGRSKPRSAPLPEPPAAAP